jgi:hypothetical protein
MSEQMRILKMIEEGEISPEEGAKMLQEIGSQPEKSETSFMKVLEQIEKGDLSTEDGIQWLNQAAPKEKTKVEIDMDPEDGAEHDPPPKISDEELNRWRHWWTYPMYVGLAIVVLSALWMNSAYQGSGYGFWFFCSWFPLALGVLLISLSWMSQRGPWIHVRVSGKDNVAVSLPAPLGLAGWALRTFGQFIPYLERTAVDEIISALDETAKSDTPLYINVDEEDGEHVEVFIG